MKRTHNIVEIDPAKFEAQVPKDPDADEWYFDEGDVLKFLIDQMNLAKINIAMINHDHEIAIEYRGRREYFSMGISALDNPEDAAIAGIKELSCILNDREDIESWTAYRNGKHALHILRKSDMDQTAIREAEDNIEGC